MAYDTKGLKDIVRSAGTTVWMLDTVDSLATAVGSGYISDAATAGSGKGAAGRGMALGDIVIVRSGVDSITAMTSITKVTPCYVSAVSATTGAGTITAVALS